MSLVSDLQYVFAQLKLLGVKQNDGESVRMTYQERCAMRKQMQQQLLRQLGEGKSSAMDNRTACPVSPQTCPVIDR